LAEGQKTSNILPRNQAEPAHQELCRQHGKHRPHPGLHRPDRVLAVAYQKFLNKIGLSVQQIFQRITLNLLPGRTPESTSIK